jgi:hypothetical protein
VVPSRDSILTSLPLAWEDTTLHTYLPKPARTLLLQQTTNFTRDWTAIQQHQQQQTPTPKTPLLTRSEYLYTWLLTNTRTFYHSTPTTAKLPRDDRMALQPIADLFNHAADPDGRGTCEVAFTPAGFDVTAERAYAEGDEVCICYGKHSNDFLLVEYGFVLGENRWDEVCLDDALLPELGEERRAVLDERGFLGGYVLDAGTVCYRTQVALRLMCVPVEEWEGLVEEGEDGGEVVQAEIDRLLAGILRKYRGAVEGTINELEGLEAGHAEQREVLVTRWRQIASLIDLTIERLES